MKRKYMQSKKANRGKKSDAPYKGLKIKKATEEVIFIDGQKQLIPVPEKILHHTLVQPNKNKPAFLRRNELIN
jgi:hypothetical protein